MLHEKDPPYSRRTISIKSAFDQIHVVSHALYTTASRVYKRLGDSVFTLSLLDALQPMPRFTP